MTRVLAMPLLDPGAGRIDLNLPEGLTVAEIVAAVLPGHAALAGRMRIVLAGDKGRVELLPGLAWERVRPRAGVTVLIRVIPADTDSLRSALTIAVSIAATALGQAWAPALVQMLGVPAAFSGIATSVAAGAITAGLTVAGGLLINALIPASVGGSDQEKPNFMISGWRNSANPDGIVPTIMGQHRYAPVFAAPPYVEIVDGKQYIHAIFLWSIGEITLADLKLGETPIGQFDEITIEHRLGQPGDGPVTLYPHQVIEEQLGTELRRDFPRNDVGDIIAGPSELAPVVRRSAIDTAYMVAIFSFAGGLGEYDDDELKPLTVDLRLRLREVGETDWGSPETVSFTARRREGFFASHRIELPSRGSWEVEFTRLTEERTATRQTDRITWLSLQSFRPEYPLQFTVPVAVTSVRALATYQLNGSLDDLNGIPVRVCLDYDRVTGTWIKRVTRNPASLFRYALQGPENAFPVPDNQIDLDLLVEWHEMCATQNLKYDRIHDFEASRWDVLTAIAAAGRAKPTELAGKWSVVIDRPQTLVVEHITPLNSRDITISRPYWTPPHAFVVPFLDETSNYQSRQRVVRWPGYSGAITITEQLSLPGVCDPVSVFRETRRRQYELIYRPERIQVLQDGLLRSTTRGDLVKASRLLFEEFQATGRVLAVRENRVSLDASFEMIAGRAYAVRFFVEGDVDGVQGLVSVVRSILPRSGEQKGFTLAGTGPVPQTGGMVMIGLAGEETTDLIVSEVESGQGATTLLSLVAHAPEIERLLARDEVPAWDGRVGEVPDPDLAVPAAPRILNVSTIFTSEIATGLLVLVAPGAGSAALVINFELRHRLSGTGAWTGPVITAAGAGAIVIDGYDGGDTVEFEIRGVSSNGVLGPYTPTIAAALDDSPPLPLPVAISVGNLSVAGSDVVVFYASPDDANFASAIIYRGPSDDFADAAELVDLPGLPLTNSTHTDTPGAGLFHYFIAAANSAGATSAPLYLGYVTF